MSRTPGRTVSQTASGGGNNRTMAITGVVIVALVLIVALVAIARMSNTTGTGGDAEVASFDQQGMTIGNPDAKILIQEFADFRCPHCLDASKTLTPKIISDYVNTGLVRFQFTPVAVINDESTFSAQAAMCANESNKFWSYHDILFSRQGKDLFSIDNLSKWAGDVGLDQQQFRNCVTSGQYLSDLQANMSEFQSSGGTGTPTFLVNGQLINGAIGYEEMKGMIDTQLASVGVTAPTQ